MKTDSTHGLILLALGLLLVLAPGCGEDYSGSAGNFNEGDTGGQSFADSNVWHNPQNDTRSSPGADTTLGYDTGPSAPPPPPPEEEIDFDLRTPEAGETFLYIPSAALDALVVVHATTLEVHLVEVGVEPTLVRALRDDDGAVVLNTGSDDVSVVRPVEGGGFEVRTLDILPDHNRLVLSPDGLWAFVWYDPDVNGAGGFGSLQDVSAVDLTPGAEEVYNLSVGFRPSRVHFSDGGRLVLFFCEDGISGIRLEEIVRDTFLPPVPIAADPFEEPLDREIAVTPDGRYAVVRDLLRRELALIDLQSRSRELLALPDYASDLELTPAGDTVIVPMINTRQVALAAVPDAFVWEAPPLADENATPEPNPHLVVSPTGAPFGASALTADGTRALLYTTQPGTAAIGMVATDTGEVFIQPLVKEIEAALVSPDGRMAALLHRRYSGDDPEVQDQNAYSLLDLDSGYAKLLTVDDPVTEVIFTEDSGELFALMPDPQRQRHLVHRVSTRSFAVIPYVTPDAPVFVGAMPAIDKVAIALDNPTGWITLVDTATGATDQINSFELNSFIE